MITSELDNPFWSSLQSRHRVIAVQAGEVARFPAEYAPFLGVARADLDVADAMASLLAPEESVYLLGVVPKAKSDWHIEAFK